jgi:transmembrane sensor
MTTDQQIRYAITQRAAEWFATHRAGPLPESGRAAFFAWLKVSPVHVEEYLGIAAAERDLGEAAEEPKMSLSDLVELARQDPSSSIVDLTSGLPAAERAPKRARIIGPLWFGAALAASLSLATIGVFWMRDGEWLGLPKTYQTARGLQGLWQLPDGSTLQLDTDSAVTVRYSSAQRLLTLEHGQALFRVTHEAHRVFRVVAGSVDMVAVGTQFDAYRRPDSTLITVLDGQVSISTQGNLSADSTRVAMPHALRLGAGQQARIVGEVLPESPLRADLRQAMSWLQKRVVFEQQPLGAVADEFNRYNSIRISIDDAALRKLPVSGAFDASDIDSFETFLASLEGVRVVRTPTRITVSSLREAPIGPAATQP